MTSFAITLIAIGIADLTRGAGPMRGARLLVGPVVVMVLGVLTAAHGASIPLLIVGGLTCVAWQVLSSPGDSGTPHPAFAFTALALGLAVLLLCWNAGPPVGGVLSHWAQHAAIPGLDRVGVDGAALILGLFLVQLGTGNVIVRLILRATGAIRPSGQPQPSDTLRGGRLLGPLERVFILGLALAGQVTAAGIVIAAKGLLRFPELTVRRDRTETQGVGIDAVTEYFLVGSFVSWLVALSCVAAAHLLV